MLQDKLLNNKTATNKGPAIRCSGKYELTNALLYQPNNRGGHVFKVTRNRFTKPIFHFPTILALLWNSNWNKNKYILFRVCIHFRNEYWDNKLFKYTCLISQAKTNWYFSFQMVAKSSIYLAYKFTVISKTFLIIIQ